MDQAIKDMLGVYGVTPDTEHFLSSEQRSDNRIIRPNAEYIGPEPRQVAPIGDR